MAQHYKEVVVILPFNHIDRTILMQLRDDKPGIDAPGLWGFFGGSIDINESPKDAAIRELKEEIGYRTTNIYLLSKGVIEDLDGIFAYSYTFNFIDQIDKFTLFEGRDFKMVKMDEVQSTFIYSNKFHCFFPIVKTYFIKESFSRAINFWSNFK